MNNIDIRTTIINCLGRFPSKANLNIKVISSEKFESYERLLIEYNVENMKE